MSNRINAFVVVLEDDMSEERAKTTIDAINHIRGVLETIPQTSDPISELIARSRLRTELLTKIFDMIKES